MDRVTGLGQTFGSWMSEGNAMLLSEVRDILAEAAEHEVKEGRQLGEIAVDQGNLHLSDYPENPFCKLDEDGYCALGSILGIPNAYMRRLNRSMREENIAYWTDELSDKYVIFTARDGYLSAVSDNDAITVPEVITNLCETLQFANYVVYAIERGTNSTMLTIVYPVVDIDGIYPMHGALRVVVPESLKAITVDPCLLLDDSCGVVEILHPDGPVQVRNSTRQEVMDSVIAKAVSAMHVIGSLGELHFWGDLVSNPVRRVDLYSREHSLPDRVATLAHDFMEDFSNTVDGVTYSDMVSMYANLGFESVVKPMSRVKCEKLAGHVLVEGASEHRCPRCDSLEL